LVDPTIATLLDWHEQDVLLAQAQRLPEPGPVLVERLFSASPLGIEPCDFGFWGALTAAEVHTLRELLETAVGAEARRADKYAHIDEPLNENDTVGLARLLLSIQPVTPGRDVVLACG
jgi:hypothetical protein